jgi:hypothetical protein
VQRQRFERARAPYRIGGMRMVAKKQEGIRQERKIQVG